MSLHACCSGQAGVLAPAVVGRPGGRPGAARPGAGCSPAVKMKELNRQAIADYAAEDYESAQLGLREAIALGQRAGLGRRAADGAAVREPGRRLHQRPQGCQARDPGAGDGARDRSGHQADRYPGHARSCARCSAGCRRAPPRADRPASGRSGVADGRQRRRRTPAPPPPRRREPPALAPARRRARRSAPAAPPARAAARANPVRTARDGVGPGQGGDRRPRRLARGAAGHRRNPTCRPGFPSRSIARPRTRPLPARRSP